ncbi:Dyp-type peroxidase [Nocardioides alcanivorans]|uniref:Dyp-type peroxidase n=1 Tax=Nocardioides alcanivorans TaxID=2897352 RepID=UPI001F2FB1E0|nr:Dyp-type peroxidase [Nocardioides alcanivorans]
METRGIGRRKLLGHVGSAVAGAAIAAPATAALLDSRSSDRGSRSPGGIAATPVISPYGAHQPGIAAPPPAASTLVALDLHDDVDRAAVVRLMKVWTTDVVALAEGRAVPGDPARDLSQPARLTVTVGLGRAPVRRFGLDAPGLVAVPAMKHDRLEERWSGGDLVLVVGGADGTSVAHAVRTLVRDARPFASVRWQQSGTWRGTDGAGKRVTGRNLFAQVDGSANALPDTDLFDRTVWIPRGPWTGGTTLVVRRILMDMDEWERLTRVEMEASVGRDLATGAPLTGGEELTDIDPDAREEGRWVIARDAHALRAHPSLNGGARIHRIGANFTETVTDARGTRVETGLLFSSYQVDVERQFTRIQQSLDESDALNEWTTAVGSAEFAVLPGFREGGWLGDGVIG